MALIADALLLAAALTAAIYCHVLAGRLKRLRSLDSGMGQAVAAMSAQVEMRTALKAAKAASGESTRTLAERTARAEMVAGRLELLLAALHDREGSDAVDLSERRARTGRSSTRVEPFSRARQNRAAPDSESYREPDPETGSASTAQAAPQAPAPAASDADAPEAPVESSEPEAPPAKGAPRARRLFRVDGEAEAASTTSRADAPADEAAGLRAALEALARETAE